MSDTDKRDTALRRPTFEKNRAAMSDTDKQEELTEKPPTSGYPLVDADLHPASDKQERRVWGFTAEEVALLRDDFKALETKVAQLEAERDAMEAAAILMEAERDAAIQLTETQAQILDQDGVRIAQLEANLSASHDLLRAKLAHIEKLEAALRRIAEGPFDKRETRGFARVATETARRALSTQEEAPTNERM